MTIAPIKDKDYSGLGQYPAKQGRFLYLLITNQALPRVARWMSRSAAVECHGDISFHRLDDGCNVFADSMLARWTGSTEPPFIQNATDKMRFDKDWVRSLHRRDIQPGNSERIDVAAQFDDDESCYGFSNENYFSEPPWRTPRWKIPPGSYIVRVEIRSGGERFVECFRLHNSGARKALKLEGAASTDMDLVEKWAT